MVKTAELLSLGLSITTIILCFAVVVYWFSAAWDAWTKKEKPTAQDWFITGVAISFFGSAVDNLYWLFPWSASFLELPIASDLFAHGMYPNIVFRQVCGALGAYCHIRAHFEFKDNPSRQHDRILVFGIFAGIAYAGLMLFAL